MRCHTTIPMMAPSNTPPNDSAKFPSGFSVLVELSGLNWPGAGGGGGDIPATGLAAGAGGALCSRLIRNPGGSVEGGAAVGAATEIGAGALATLVALSKVMSTA